MTELFDSISIEVYNSTWVDVTTDVRQKPNPRWNRGIMSNRPNERIGHAGIFTFNLDNSTSNSAGLAGYYSPGHSNCWSGWTTGLPVRLGFLCRLLDEYRPEPPPLDWSTTHNPFPDFTKKNIEEFIYLAEGDY